MAEGLFGDSISDLEKCVGEHFRVRAFTDAQRCERLSTFDVYYLTRFAHWLLIPSTYERAETDRLINEMEIDALFGNIIPEKYLASQISLIESGGAIAFGEYLGRND